MKTKLLKKIGAICLSTAMLIPSFSTVFGADNILGNDTIDLGKKGSIALHKYDYTAITEDNVNISDLVANGEKDEKAESRLSRYVIPGVEFSYIKVADIHQNEDVNQTTKLTYQLDDKLLGILGLSKGVHDSTELNTNLDNILRGDTRKNTESKNKLEQYIEKAKKTRFPLTDSFGATYAGNLDLGLYLIVETKVPANVHSTVNPFFVSVPMTDITGNKWFYDINMYPKNQSDIPTLDKQVRQNDDKRFNKDSKFKDSATGSTGDVMDYITVSKLPKITSEASYLTKYDYEDIAEKNLVYLKDNVTVSFYNSDEEARKAEEQNAILKLEKNQDFTVTYDDSANTYNKMQVKMTEAGLKKMNNAMSEKYMVVSYKMRILKNNTVVLGDIGNTNNVELVWGRTNTTDFDRLKARCRVYTYGINLTKEFTKGDKDIDFTKVKFILKNVTDGRYVQAIEGSYSSKKSNASKGVYIVDDQTKNTTEKEAATILTCDDKGSLIIKGLEADTYELTEVKTSDGFQILKKPITIVIKETKDEFIPTVTTHYDYNDKKNNPNKDVIEIKHDRASSTVNGKTVAMESYNNATKYKGVLSPVTSENSFVPMKVVNTPMFRPPFTGAKGNTLFAVGLLAVASIGYLFFTRKEKKLGSNEK